MAKTQQKDILTRFQDLTAEALHRLQDVPGGSKLVEAVNDTKARLDEMQKKLRGLDELEKRVAKLEKQLAGQSKKPAARRKSTTAPKTAPAPNPPAE
jgi:polyhydroxyalkanoate synthesis regulator phasin